MSGLGCLLAVIALTAMVQVGVESCAPYCNTTCTKYNDTNTCDGKCITLYGPIYSNHTCGRCESKCLSACNRFGAGYCDNLCIKGYCVNTTTFHCQAVAHCIACSPSYPTCVQCEAGYSAISGSCQPCDNACTTNCTAAGTCPNGMCKDPGFASVLVPGSTTLYACGACQNKCAGSCKVHGADKCDSVCVANYALNPTTFQCQPCCSNCTSGCVNEGPGFCDSTCATGYTWSTAKNDTSKHACYLTPPP